MVYAESFRSYLTVVLRTVSSSKVCAIIRYDLLTNSTTVSQTNFDKVSLNTKYFLVYWYIFQPGEVYFDSACHFYKTLVR
ncbi:hypothetical protein NIES4073_32760 [Kalymmatonema gypsitolerans NIES-4073]|nr:hypothetical protein NIES4073_32760 [Scytonema sp. NIES-4073]